MDIHAARNILGDGTLIGEGEGIVPVVRSVGSTGGECERRR
jgi:hypothetical protein